MFYDRKKYILNDGTYSVEVEEPTNWREDNKSLERNLQYHGITIMLAGPLSFTGEGKTFLENAFNTHGINADVSCTKYIRNDQTDLWEVDYVGYIDFMTMIINKNTFDVNFNADPFTTKFKSKLGTKVELERTTSLTGKDLLPLSLQDLYIEGRAILETSKLVNDEFNKNYLECYTNTVFIAALPINETGDLNAGITDVGSQTIWEQREWNNVGTISEAFIGVNETQYDFKYRVSIIHKQSCYWTIIKNPTVSIKLRIAIFKDGFAQNFDNEVVLWEYSGSPKTAPVEININTGEFELNIPVGYSASLQWIVQNTSSNTNDNYFVWTWAYPLGCPQWVFGEEPDPNRKCVYLNATGQWTPAFYEISVTIQEDSERVPSNSPAIKVYDFAKRLNDIVVEGGFKSDLLQNDDVSDLLLLHGMWLRGMKAGVPKYKPIATSFGDFLISLDSIYPIGLDIIDGVLSIEKRDYYYQKYISIRLGDVTDMSVSPSQDDYMTLIRVGYDKAGGYNENQGLDEYNRETTYDTILNKITNELELVCKFRADSYGLETARRENPNVGTDVNEDKDAKFDDEIWFVDCNKTTGTSYEISSWEKRFAQPPKGVYSPETAFNIWLSPINIMLRYGKWIKPALAKYLDSMIAFSSSEGNSTLTTKLIGGNEYAQNVGIPVKDLDFSMHSAMDATFKAPFSWSQIKGTTNGKPNMYGLAEFQFAGVKYRGYIISIKIENGIGDFKVKISNTFNTTT